ncbi:hypothetical protein ABT247_05700 [Kitasatospora sp. NPDC001539]|uniref:hypothetical protein n=1 Tax=Kitasatospora sp. NPDC001539 TaxID=3154384 RepID=UPI003324607C
MISRTVPPPPQRAAAAPPAAGGAQVELGDGLADPKRVADPHVQLDADGRVGGAGGPGVPGAQPGG